MTIPILLFGLYRDFAMPLFLKTTRSPTLNIIRLNGFPSELSGEDFPLEWADYHNVFAELVLEEILSIAGFT